MNPARLVVPAIRWSEATGFDAAMDAALEAVDAGVGGFIIFGGRPDRVARLTATLRARARHPLLIAADLERGAGQQFAGLTEFPPPAALAALDDPEAIRTAAIVTAREALGIGVNWIFAPVADLDLLPDNPIVQTRAFGAEPVAVGAAVRAWVEACQAAGALACAKHYPGHGRTRVDSHAELPVVDASSSTLDRSDLVPFDAAIAGQVASVMTAHVAYPGLDPTGTPATFSRPILDDLRSRRGYNGLVVSDALVMAGALQGRSEAVAAEQALAAGVDLFLYPADPAAVIAHLAARLARSPELAARAEASLARLTRALERIGTGAGDANQAGAAAALRDRLLGRGMVRGARPVLREPVDLVVVDDDLDGDYPPTPSDGVEAALHRCGTRLGTGGSRVVAVFAEPRAGKGRADLGPRALKVLSELAPSPDLIVLFAHPRLVQQLPAGVPVLLAWHRQAGMQASVGEWIAASVRTEG